MVSSMSISIARGSWFMMSGPFHFRRHRRQDRVDIAAGFQSEGGAAVIQQDKFDVAAAPYQLLLAVSRRPRRGKVVSHQFGIELQERAADILREGEVGVPVAGIVMIVKD